MHLGAAIELLLRWDVIATIVGAAIFGLFIGAIPGLTATMAIALLVPLTFFMDPVPAIGAMIACSAMAIFAGDIPATLLRMPGTPASAAYAEEAYQMARKGEAELALGANLLFSVIGGLFGSLVLIVGAPALAEIALLFSSYEYFWMALLGVSSAVFLGAKNPLRGIISLCIGLLIASIGLNNPAGVPRFTFGSTELLGGVDFIAAMIGLFAVSEVLRSIARGAPRSSVLQTRVGNPFKGWMKLAGSYRIQQIRGNITGVVIGILPGAGCDIAAWVSYAISRRFSKTPEKYGTGHLEGIVESTSSNNAAMGGTWIPSLVFGIPGDSVTAIVIGVLYIKGLNPGPTIFDKTPEIIYAVLLIFIVANLLMLPLGWAAIKLGQAILRIRTAVLMPSVLAFSIVGAFATTNSLFTVIVMFAFGVLGLLMEENEIPLAPCILGIVLGPLLESSLITSLIKSGGNPLAFIDRPVAGVLFAVALLVWFSPFLSALLTMRRPAPMRGVPESGD